ncbi:MAG: hypothetical protein V4660_18210 [Pseudomonadota bacterium]
MKKESNPVLNLNFLNNYSLEDDIYLRIEKLQALCSTQTMLDSNGVIPDTDVRFHYGMVIEEQVAELRRLLDALFK